jgi:hypothetical protein
MLRSHTHFDFNAFPPASWPYSGDMSYNKKVQRTPPEPNNDCIDLRDFGLHDTKMGTRL